MPLITFNLLIIATSLVLHLIIKPIYKKRYPFKLVGTLLIGIGMALLYDLIPLTCYLIIKLNDYIK